MAGAVVVAGPALPAAAAAGDAVPSTAIALPEGYDVPLLGEDLTFTVTFDNTPSGAGSNTGYGPRVDLYLDTTGADGAGDAEDDGLSFKAATYLGTTVAAQVTTISSCTMAHPQRGDAIQCPSGIGVGDQLVTLTLPFGSFTAEQPPVELLVTTAMSPLADLDTPLAISTLGWFQYGLDPLDNPTPDPAIIGSFESETFSPQIARLRQWYEGPEDETASGPSWQRGYRSELDVATGQTVTDVSISNPVPANQAFVSASASGGGSVTSPAIDEQGGTVSAAFASVPGGSGSADAILSRAFYVARTASSAVIDPATGDDVSERASAGATGTWTPVDPRDSTATFSVASNEHTLVEKSIAVQKRVELIDDRGGKGPTPDDTLRWSIEGQVSDWFAFDDLELRDVAGDGVDVDLSTARITFSTATGLVGPFAIPSSDYSTNDGAVTCPTGETVTTFDLSNMLATLSGDHDPLVGALVENELRSQGGARFSITYDSTILPSYRCTPADGSRAVSPGDRLTGQVTVDGRNLDTATLTAYSPEQRESDSSSTYVLIEEGALAQSVYAKNGSTAGPFGYFSPGDTITYRLTQTLPIRSFEQLKIVDYFPLPVLDATEYTGRDSDTGAGNLPEAGEYSFGPNHTGIAALVPKSVTERADQNSLTFDFGTNEDPTDTGSVTIDLLVTLTIGNAPFADGLMLTNQVRSSQTNSFTEASVADALTEFELAEPDLRITKGVIGTSASSAAFTGTRGPVAFTGANDTDAPRWEGTVASSGLAASPVDADVSGVDAGDTVSFAIVVENTGRATRGAFDVTISDTLPSGFEPAPANVQVTNGAGAAISYTGDLFSPSGITLHDPSPDQGSVAAFSPGSGTNVVVVTYDLVVADTKTIGGTTTGIGTGTALRNTATLAGWATAEGATRFPSDSDDALATTGRPGLVKSITGISEPTGQSMPGSTGNTVIGSVVTYSVTVTVPEGRHSEFVVRDTMAAGLTYVDGSAGAPQLATGISSTGSPASPTTSETGQQLIWNFGTVTNADRDADDEEITLTYRALVTNIAANQSAAQRKNVVVAGDDGLNPVDATAETTVTVREPVVTLSSSVSDATPDAGDLLTWSVTVTAGSGTGANAYDTSIRIPVPSGTDWAGGVSVPSGWTSSFSDEALTVTPPASLAPGASGAFSFQTRVATTAADTITMTPVATWSSLPGTDANERTGAGGTNDYRATDSETVTLDSGSLTKDLVQTSYSATDGGRLTIGETATYRIRFQLPEGQLPGFTVLDDLPAGLEYVSHELRSAEFQGTLPAPTVTRPNGDLRLDFGATTVSDDNDGANDVVMVDVTARVRDVTGNTGAPTTTSLTNTATLTVGSRTTSDTEIVTVAEPKLSVDVEFGATPARPGDVVPITVTVRNIGDSTAEDVDLAALLEAADAWTDLATATAADGFTASISGSTFSYRGGSIPAGGTATFTMTARIAAAVTNATPLTVRADTVGTSLPGPATGERTTNATDSDAIAANTPDLAVVIEDGLATAEAGDPVTWTITVDNLGPADATGVVATVTIPAELLDAITLPTGATRNGNTIALPVFDLDAAAAARVFTITATLRDPLPADAAAVPSTASVSDDGTHGADVNTANNTDSDSISLGSTPELQIRKSDGRATATAGEELTYRITVTNVGTRGAGGFKVTDTLPEGLTFVSASAGGVWEATGRTITWNDLVLEGGGTELELTVAVTVDAAHPAGRTGFVNTATTEITSGVAEADPSDNSASDTTSLGGGPDLVVEKSDGVDTAQLGDELTYVVTVRNTGARGASGVVVVDTLPTGTTFVSAGTGGGYDAAARTVTWAVSELEALTGEVTFEVTVTVDTLLPAGQTTIVNTASVADDGANGDDTDLTNNTDTDADTTGADLVVIKSNGVDEVARGAVVTWVITVQNEGPQDVENLVLSEALPGELVGTVDYRASEGDFDAVTGEWRNLTLDAGTVVTLEVTGTVDPDTDATELANTVTVETPGVNVVDPTGLSATDTDALVADVVLGVGIVADQPVVEKGEQMTWTVTVRNTGVTTARNPLVTVTLPQGFTFEGPVAGWTCSTQIDRTFQCEYDGSVAAGGSVSFRFTTLVTENVQPGPQVAEASVTNVDSEGVTTTVSDDDAVTIPAPVPPLLAMTGATGVWLLALALLLAAAGTGLILFRRRPRSES